MPPEADCAFSKAARSVQGAAATQYVEVRGSKS
jgi:hypothetical protein